MAKHSHWLKLWWAILQHFGEECYHTWVSEVVTALAGGVAGALTEHFRSHGHSSFTDSLVSGSIGAGVVFGMYAVVNLFRSVWLEHKSETAGTTRQGVGGAIVLFALIGAIALGVVLEANNIQTEPIILGSADPGQIRSGELIALEECRSNYAILTQPEPSNSLRRRTNKLADEILAWEQERYEHHPSYAYPDKQRDPDPTLDRQKLIEACLKYDRETFDQFNRKFKEEWIEIVRKYDLENVKVGTLVNDAEQNHPAQDASMGAQFVPVQMDNGTYFSALSRFRELAYHVDASGHRIDLHEAALVSSLYSRLSE